MRRRNSFLFSVALTFLAVYTVSSVVYFVRSNLKYYDSYTQKRMLHVVNSLKLGVTLLKNGDVKSLAERLEESRELHEIDFFILKRGEEVVAFGNADRNLEGINADYKPNQMVIRDNLAFSSVAVGDYLLALGINKRKSDYLLNVIRNNPEVIFLDIGLALAMVLGVVIYFFRDIRAMIDALQSRGAGRFRAIRAISQDSLVMLKGLRSLETQVERLHQQKNDLRSQILPALRTEMDSGKKPPYQFACTMARTDINEYSTIFSTFPVEEFTEVINEFFLRSSEIIARYRGYVANFLGDEIIFYFKDEEHRDSVTTALAAIRDIHALAREIHHRTTRGLGYPFRVKSAISTGNVRYGQQVFGNALSGGVFVESVRILSQISEKSENSAFLPTRLSHRLHPVAESAEWKSVELKGIPGRTSLSAVTRFAEVGEIRSARDLVFFRSEADAAEVLDQLKRDLESGEEPRRLREKVVVLGQNPVPYASPEIYVRYVGLLSEAIRKAEAGQDKELLRLLSAILSLAASWVHRDRFDGKLRALFVEALAFEDRRVVSNSVEMFVHFDPTADDEALARLSGHTDNRVMANSLIKQARVSLDRKVISGLRRMLESDQPVSVASGLYAIGEISKHYIAEDPLFYDTHIRFHDLVKMIPEFVDHPDEMVQRQAKIALEKTALSRDRQPKAA